MASSFSVEAIVGDDAFSKYGLKPWWERVHYGILNLYLGFLFAFGLLSVDNQPSCIPTNGTDYDRLTTTQAKYISDYCEEFEDNSDPAKSFLAVICYAVFIELTTSLGTGFIFTTKAFAAFAKAEEMFLKAPKNMATSSKTFLVLLSDPSAKELRNVAEVLLQYDPRTAVSSMVSREVFLLIGTATNIVFIVLAIIQAPESASFQCAAEVNFTWSTENTTFFSCMRPWNEGHLQIAWIYYFAVILQFSSRLSGVYFVAKTLNSMRPHPDLRSAKTFLWLSSLSIVSRTEDGHQFGQFVRSLLSVNGLSDIQIHIKAVGQNADHLLSKLSRHGDSDFIRPNPKALSRLKWWKWVVYLVNKKFPEVDDPVLLGDTSPDSEGNSLLFHALNREPGGDFSLRAAEKILKYSKVLKREHVEMTAEEFIQEQYLKDPTYPERLKDHFINIIRSPEESSIAEAST